MSGKIQLKPLLSKHILTTEHTVIHNNQQCYTSYEQEL